MSMHSDNLVAPGMLRKRRHVKKSGCANGLYAAPAANAQVNASQPLSIQWDNTCYNPAPTAVDIYMTAPYNANPQVYTWFGVEYSSGSYAATLKPQWWNSTDSVSLQLNIVPAGQPAFLTTFPSAPLFTVNYDPSTAPASATSTTAGPTSAVHESPYTVVDNWFHSKGLTKGQLGAAVLIPLLVVFTAVGYYVRITRKKEAKKRERWSKAVDKRMSTISTDWKSMSGAAASHAIRQSMVIPSGENRSTRTSSFFAGNGPLPRPESQWTDAGQAGLGIRYNNGLGLGGALANNNNSEAGGRSSSDDMAQIRRPPGAAASSPTARVSRISFATDSHPRASMAGDSVNARTSIYTNGTRGSRAYHKSFYLPDDGSVPPVPSPNKNFDEMELELSPTQARGPETFPSPGEIRSRVLSAVDDYESRPSVDVGLLKMPAMTMMRTSEASNDLVLPPQQTIEYPAMAPAPSPSPMAPAHIPVPTTFSGLTPLHEESSAFSSPDAMLKAYAIKKKASVLASQPQVTPAAPPRSNSVVGFVKRRNTHNQNPNEKATGVQVAKAETTTSANGGMRILYAPSAPPSSSAHGTHYSNESAANTSAYDEDSYSAPSAGRFHPGTQTHSYSESFGTETEEGVVTYGQRTTLVIPQNRGVSTYHHAEGEAEVEDTNPFRKSMKVLSAAYSDASRYSTNGPDGGR